MAGLFCYVSYPCASKKITPDSINFIGLAEQAIKFDAKNWFKTKIELMLVLLETDSISSTLPHTLRFIANR